MPMPSPVLEAMDIPLTSKSITLTCGKLCTGVTVRPWTGIFMLRNSSTPETYFQAAFRVQSPWTVMNPDGNDPNREQIIKEESYVFDFAPDRALRQIWEYAARLNVDETDPLKKVEEFISFLPVLAYDGSSMKQIDAAGILDIAMSGTSATLLARRWESALLVNVDNATLARLMNNKKAMEALMSIEGFLSFPRSAWGRQRGRSASRHSTRSVAARVPTRSVGTSGRPRSGGRIEPPFCSLPWSRQKATDAYNAST
ncbi:MAG TPA: hypothetical protein VMP01_22100, partial [Pirellulaceae bacterium]|nr:hypothetical protein [Pirellulaceae bacterium]